MQTYCLTQETASFSFVPFEYRWKAVYGDLVSDTPDSEFFQFIENEEGAEVGPAFLCWDGVAWCEIFCPNDHGKNWPASRERKYSSLFKRLRQALPEGPRGPRPVTWKHGKIWWCKAPFRMPSKREVRKQLEEFFCIEAL